MAPRAFVCGVRDAALSAEERRFLGQAEPWGLILFARNIEDAEQIRRLCGEFREAVGRDAPVLIDQEGGRVQRIRPPLLRPYPPASLYGSVHDRDEPAGREIAWLAGRLIGADLADLSITIDCIPCLDLPAQGAHSVIGDRALGRDPETIAVLGSALARGLMEAGVLPVMKHAPGHGRAMVDSHAALPIVRASAEELLASDFVPFGRLAGEMPFAMTAHVVYTALDPDNPATLSEIVIREVIRGRIGFDGALMTDDISMGALAGSLRERSERALQAGCDIVLHCNGEMGEMAEVAEAAPVLSGKPLARVTVALASRRPGPLADHAALIRRFDEHLHEAAAA